MAATVLLFDSGVGGLSLLPELERAVPAGSLVYASDNAAHPYGTLDANALTLRVGHVLERLVAAFEPELLIVACNTASTVALPRLRATLELPVVGVVPAIKPAAATTRSGVIALLGTPATVRRAYTERLIEQFASRCEILRLGSGALVSLAEEKLRGRAPTPAQMRDALAPLLDNARFGAADVVVLGCTHFPLLRAELAAAVPGERHWVDSGEAVARRTAQLLAQQRKGAARAAPARAVFTRDGDEVSRLEPALRALGFQDIGTVEMPFRRAAPTAAERDAAP